MHPKSFVSNFWGAVQSLTHALFIFLSDVIKPEPVQQQTERHVSS